MRKVGEYLSPWKAAAPASDGEDDSSNDVPSDENTESMNMRLSFGDDAAVSPKRPSSAAKKKKAAAAAAKTKTKTKQRKKSPAAKGRKAPEKKSPKAAAKARKPTVVKVKTEPMRRSRRASGYKKGSFSVAHMERLAWRGAGTNSDPITFKR